MSIKLTEKDIKAIARERATGNWFGWFIVGLALLWFASIFVTNIIIGAYPVQSEWTVADTLLLAGGVALLCLTIPALVVLGRKERRILKQLKQEHGEPK